MITLFGIALATWLRSNPNLQHLVDTSQGIYVSTTYNCSDINLVTAHSYTKLGEKIAKLDIGDKITVNNCTYKITNYQIHEIATTKMSEVYTDKNTLYLSTCADDSNKYNITFTAKLLKKRTLSLK